MTNKEMYEFLIKTRKQRMERIEELGLKDYYEKCNELFFAFRDRVLKNKEET